MKSFKNFILVLLSTIFCLGFTACSSDSDDNESDGFDKSLIIGTWVGTHINRSGTWVELGFGEGFSAKFNKDGTYYGSGYYGTGSGTYEFDGKTIKTYVEGELYFSYKIVSLNGETGELIMYDRSGASQGIRVKKEK